MLNYAVTNVAYGVYVRTYTCSQFELYEPFCVYGFVQPKTLTF